MNLFGVTTFFLVIALICLKFYMIYLLDQNGYTTWWFGQDVGFVIDFYHMIGKLEGKQVALKRKYVIILFGFHLILFLIVICFLLFFMQDLKMKGI